MPTHVNPRRWPALAVVTTLALAGTLVGVRAAAAATPTYAGHVLASAPIAYYRLGEPNGTTMTDSTGNGHDGTYTAGVVLGGAPGITVDTDTSAFFSGADDGQAAGASAPPAPTAAYTWEAWIRRADNADGSIAGQEGAGQLLVRSDTLVLHQTDTDVASAGPALVPGTWYHVAATWDGVTTRLYVDGVEVAASLGATTAPSGSGTVHVGSGDQAPDFHGDLDEVAYYPTALSAATVQDHHVIGADALAPDVTITTPADNGEYVLHAVPAAVYDCTDPAPSPSGVASCTDSGRPTTLGPHLFTVTGTDRAGNETSETVAYTVVPNRYADEVLLSSPLAYYRLDDAVGSTTMTDASGHGNDGTYRNAVAPGGHRPAAISCERRPDPPRVCDLAADPEDFATHFGGQGYGYLNGLAAPTTAYTLEAWIKPDDTGDGSIVGQGGAGQLYVHDGHLALRQTQDDVVSSGPDLTPGTWWHVAATWNGVTTRLYVNGTQVASSTSARKAPSGTATTYVGLGDQAPEFRGDLDEVAYYPTALSGGVIAEHYAVATAIDWPSIPPVPPHTNTGKPSAIVVSPADDGWYAPNKTPALSFTCTDPDGPGDVAGCTATVDGVPAGDGDPLPDTPGGHAVTVTATDTGGNSHVHTVTYTVATFDTIYNADSPIAYYRLADTGAVMADASGNGRDGEYKNRQESGPVGVSGDGDHARRFWGDGGYGYTTSVAAGPQQATIEAWANPDDLRDQSIAGLAGSDELLVLGGLFAYRHEDRLVTADVGPTPGSFSQVVGVWDGATIVIYVDGEPHGIADAATGRSQGAGTFYVGFGTLAPWFLGSLDEVAYYGSALTPARVYQHFLADPPPSSTAPAACRVPALRGLRLAAARTALERSGCRLGTVTRQHTGWRQRGRVVAQSVPAGSTVGLGRAVRVTVGRR